MLLAIEIFCRIRAPVSSNWKSRRRKNKYSKEKVTEFIETRVKELEN
jgi:hypothetical protein